MCYFSYQIVRSVVIESIWILYINYSAFLLVTFQPFSVAEPELVRFSEGAYCEVQLLVGAAGEGG